MRYSLVTAPTSEPVTLAEAKVQLSIPTGETYWDNLITDLIKSARESVENMTYRGLMTQTWKMFIDGVEFEEFIEISKVPIQSITHIKYYDSTNTLVTMDPSNYVTDLSSTTLPARVQILDLPTVKDRLNSVEIQFVCGWSSSANVPNPIKSAIKLIVGHLFNHREDVIVGAGSVELPLGVKHTLLPFTLNWFYK